VKFNWIIDQARGNVTKMCVDLEYELRPKIVRFLMARLEQECSGDFSNFYFDVNIKTREIRISNKTPESLAAKIRLEFESEINDTLKLSRIR